MIGQGHNEAILRSHLAKHGVQVELNTELVDFERTSDGVVAQIVKHGEAGDVKETIHAEYLVGADGARSQCAYHVPWSYMLTRSVSPRLYTQETGNPVRGRDP